MRNCLVWIFGRGASAACGLNWTVPTDLEKLDRHTQLSKIKDAIRQEMRVAKATPYKNLLNKLSASTKHNWSHRFITTNWDYLLEQEIENLNLQVAPTWLRNTHVAHLNGTVEELEDNSNRSPFLLETDAATVREQTIEANKAFNSILTQQTFIVVGMSFFCEMDRSLLSAISRLEDDYPIGESIWLIINDNEKDIDQVKKLIKTALPRSDVKGVHVDFGIWCQGAMDELIDVGVIAA